jgi:glycosyltransferase involved in cell wall biosynthesis
MPPEVDVIIPFHRNDPYLRDAILSVIESKHVSPRIILVNDSGKSYCLDEFAPNARIKLIQTSSQGYANALNSALPHVRSRFIAFLDSDDLNDPFRLSKQIKQLVSYGAAISICKIRKFSNTKKTVRAKLRSNSIHEFDPYVHLISYIYTNSTWVIDRDKLPQIEKWNSRINHTLSDWYFFQENFIPLEGKIVYLDEALYLQRVHTDQISKNVKSIDCSGEFFLKWKAYSDSLGIKNMQEADCSVLLFPWRYKLNFSILNLRKNYVLYKKIMKAYSNYISNSDSTVTQNFGFKYKYVMRILLIKRILTSYIPES